MSPLSDATHVSGRRLVAHWIDTILIGLLGLMVLAACAGLGALTGQDDLFATIGVVLFFAWVLVGQAAFFVYHGRERGSSPGKGLAGIRVVDASGRTPSTSALIRRSLPLAFEWFYVIAFVAMMSSPHRQRLGDRWAGTYVVPDDGPLQ